MDNEAKIETPDKGRPAAEQRERPLVSFVLFAYNHEKYIREAVEGAFSQTYEPLEIILSDDCSMDRTFEIMQEMVAAYRGPHKVRAVQTQKNLGVVPHVLLRGREAVSDIVVMAAGDDVSLPSRVVEHVAEYDDPSVFGVCGAFDLIDERGNLIASGVKEPILASKIQSYFKQTNEKYVVIQGSTESFRKDVFLYPLPAWSILFSEDNLFNFLIYAHGGRVSFISNALIRYRVHERALSNKGQGRRPALEIEAESLHEAEVHANKMKTFMWIAERSEGAIVDTRAICKSMRYCQEVLNWPSYSFITRLQSIIAEVVLHRAKFLKWKIARLIGNFPRYQPKLFISRFQKQYRSEPRQELA